MVLVTNPRAVDFRDESQKFPVSVSTLSTRVATTTAFVCYAKGQPVDSLDIFEVLVRENSRMLTAFIQSAVRNPAAVDDIWQETMVTAWKRWDDFDRSQPFGAWLRGIARNNIRSWQRATAKTIRQSTTALLNTSTQSSLRFKVAKAIRLRKNLRF